MRRIHLAALIAMIALVAVGFGLYGCSKQPTSSGVPGEGNLALTATLTTDAFQQQIDLFRLRVTGVGVDTTFFLDFDGRYITGRVDVPAGQRLTFVLTAEELIVPPQGGPATDTVVIYRGVTEAFVAPGIEVQISIALEPMAPMIRLSPKYSRLESGGTAILELTVHNIKDLGAIAVAIDFGYFTDQRYITGIRSSLSRTLDSTRTEFLGYYFNDDTQYLIYANDTTGGRIVDANGNGTIARIEFDTRAFSGTINDFADLSFGQWSAEDISGTAISPEGVYVETAQLELLPLLEQTVYIPDADFRGLVQYQLGVDDTLFTFSQVLTIEYFYGGEGGITSLEGIQYFLNAEYLELGYNEISDLTPLRDLRQVRYLYLQYNSIENVEALSGLLNLSQLRLEYNQIEDIAPLVQNAAAGGLGMFDAVYLTGNPLNSISVDEYLKELSAYGVTVEF